MKKNIGKMILSCYNLFLAFSAIYAGIIMILGKLGDYPPEWLNRVPFTNWIYPGVIAIVVYGIGNLIAAGFSVIHNDRGLIASAIMGVIFLISILLSIKVLGETYLVTWQFIFLSIIQIALTIFAIMFSSKNKNIITEN